MRNAMSASQKASGGPRSVPTWYSRPNASTVARSPGGLRYSSSGRISHNAACSSTTIQTTSRGRARISSMTSEVKRMNCPGCLIEAAAGIDRAHKARRQLRSNRGGNLDIGLRHGDDRAGIDRRRLVPLAGRGDGGEKSAVMHRRPKPVQRFQMFRDAIALVLLE